MKQQPDGFAINYNRYRASWCWRQTVGVEDSKQAGHVVERVGLRSRNAALADLLDEVERRKQSAITPKQTQTQTTAPTG